MADVYTPSFTHTYAGKELIDELFFQPEEMNPSLAEWYKFIPVVGDKVNVYLPQSLKKILRTYSTCGFSATGGVSTIVDKTLSVEKVKVNLEECVDAWDDTIFAETMKTGVDRDNLSGTDIDNIIRQQFVKALKSDIHRTAWFADSGDADADWNQFDGWITRAIANSASFESGAYFDMSSNETAGVLNADGALAVLRQMWENQSATLRNVPQNDKCFYVTNTVIDNYATTLENQGNIEGQRYIQDGIARYFFRGVELKPVPEWDVNLGDATNPHETFIGDNLIVYTSKDNLVFGSDVSAGESSFRVRYSDDDDEKMKVISKFKLGTQIMHYELISMAY